MSFLVRKNCEYSLLVDADTEESAIKTAASVPLEEWDTAWAPDEAEPYQNGAVGRG